jgi:hypothetical protein
MLLLCVMCYCLQLTRALHHMHVKLSRIDVTETASQHLCLRPSFDQE